jgi:alkylation response protein AidB-like acyl-CoA dehydrogenase
MTTIEMMTIDEFVDEARAFLDADADAELKSEEEAPFVWGQGSDDVSLFDEPDPEKEKADLIAGKRFAARRYDAGFGWIDGPVELGGRGLTLDHTGAYVDLEERYAIPNVGFLNIARGYLGPTIQLHGRPGVAEHFLPRLYRGDLVACQLFSEPNAGSDLAAAATRAVRDGDEWVLNGQKVWTSNAHFADVGVAVTRTDPDAPKHRGISVFLVDMHAPGVEVRPLRQMTGGAGFNEVFLTDVRVPDAHMLGELNNGFGVILTTLGNERTMGSRKIGGVGRGIGPFERLIGLVQHCGDPADPHTRQLLALLYSQQRVRELTNLRWMSSMKAGQTPGPEMSMLKLLGSKHHYDVVALLTHVLGPRLAADTGEWGTFAWNGFALAVPGGRIGGGTDEILRNTLGEKVLGLPKEPKPA